MKPEDDLETKVKAQLTDLLDLAKEIRSLETEREREETRGTYVHYEKEHPLARRERFSYYTKGKIIPGKLREILSGQPQDITIRLDEAGDTIDLHVDHEYAWVIPEDRPLSEPGEPVDPLVTGFLVLTAPIWVPSYIIMKTPEWIGRGLNKIVRSAKLGVSPFSRYAFKEEHSEMDLRLYHDKEGKIMLHIPRRDEYHHMYYYMHDVESLDEALHDVCLKGSESESFIPVYYLARVLPGYLATMRDEIESSRKTRESDLHKTLLAV